MEVWDNPLHKCSDENNGRPITNKVFKLWQQHLSKDTDLPNFVAKHPGQGIYKTLPQDPLRSEAMGCTSYHNGIQVRPQSI